MRAPDGDQRFVLLSGCSGGGKSTLLAELARRGFATVEEPGRRIVAEELGCGGAALPWISLEAFSKRAIAVSLDDLARASSHIGWVFFDRGLIDAAAALEHATGEPAIEVLCRGRRFHPLVFLTPPWPEIYVQDRERSHEFEEAVTEYERLLPIYARLGYSVMLLPKADVCERADLVLEALQGASP